MPDLFAWLWPTEVRGADVPDVTAAWDEAVAALRRGGVDLRDRPLFLVLGRTAGPTERLFQAARLQLTAGPLPARADAPLQAWTTAQAVYLTCADASALGRRLAGPARDAASDRFEHLCRLLVRDRRPYCPLNGVLVLVPFAALADDQAAADAAAAVRRDLAVVRRVLRVNAPTLALVCDVEAATGFATFLSRFSETQRRQRVGQRCPLLPDLRGAPAAKAQAELCDGLGRWLCGSVVPAWVYKNFRLEAGPEERAAAARDNAELFLFMEELWERRRRLGRLLAEGMADSDGEPMAFGGCYLGGTGGDAGREQAFVAGVFRRLSEEENFVTWTRQAMREEELLLRLVSAAKAVLGVLLAALLVLAGLLVFGG